MNVEETDLNVKELTLLISEFWFAPEVDSS